jgi:uncharacterized membrane protein
MAETPCAHKQTGGTLQGFETMARRRSRFLMNRRDRPKQSAGFDPAAMIRLTGFVAALLVLIGVAAGFQGDRFATALARGLAVLGPLAEPVIFGASWLELGVGLVACAVIAVMAVRSLRR